MPQHFQVLRCYKCLVFQIHQSKKSNKFECKMCGEKQSIKRHYGLGTSRDCRSHVQKLNGLRGELDEQKEKKVCNSDYDNDEYGYKEDKVEISTIVNSKWSHYIEHQKEAPDNVSNDSMYLDNQQVVLEIPKTKRRKFHTPIKKGEITVTQHGMGSNSHVSFMKHNNCSNKKSCTVNSNLTDTCFSNSEPEPNINLSKPCDSQNLKKVQNNKMKVDVNEKQEDKKSKMSDTYESKEEIKQINSKWTKYVDSDEENVSSPSPNCPQSNSNALFSLCDDDELDDVLEF